MGSFISWLDHSEEDQRKVREMLQLFSDKDTVDDLGIGTVRDAISNALFPGTSVIQTRARYFLFIPWIFRRAEQRHPQQLVAKATDMERFLIAALKAGGDQEGLIGRQAGANIRTLPSTIFWGGLVRYSIFLAPELSIRQYGRHVARGVTAADAEDEIGERVPSFWHRDIPDPPAGFFNFKNANFELTVDESEWLCERIIYSEDSRHGSLLTGYVRDLQRGGSMTSAEQVWAAGLPVDTSTVVRDLVDHAERFSCAANGAALLYNLMLAEERETTGHEVTENTSQELYRDLLAEWRSQATRVRLSEWAANISLFWECLIDVGALVPYRTRRFVDEWASFLAVDVARVESSTAARAHIRNRELDHKRGQARLANKKRLDEWTGYAGTTPLGFRWPQVRRILDDIANGLSRVEPEAEHAVA